MNKNITHKNTHTLDVNNNLSQDEQKELCKQLRIETGYGLMDCKKALNENSWNYEKSKNWIKQNIKRPFILY